MGALTSKTYAFRIRNWEITSCFAYDFFDSMMPSIRVDKIGSTIIRILPLSETWISDKTRFFHDALCNYRLLSPIFCSSLLKFPVSWRLSFEKFYLNYVFKKPYKFFLSFCLHNINFMPLIISGILNKFNFVFGKFTDRNLVKILSSFSDLFGNNVISFFKNNYVHISDIRESFSSYDLIKSNEFNFDVLVLFSLNPRFSSPKLNVSIRNSFNKNNLVVFSIGSWGDFTYPFFNLGNSFFTLIEILRNKSVSLLKFLLIKNRKLSVFKLCLLLNLNYLNSFDFFSLNPFEISYYIQNKLMKLTKLFSVTSLVFYFPTQVSSFNISEYGLTYSLMGISNKYHSRKFSSYFLYLTDFSSIAFPNFFGNWNFKAILGQSFTWKDCLKSDLLFPCTSFFEENIEFITYNNKIKRNLAIISRFSNLVRKSSIIFYALFRFVFKSIFFKLNLFYNEVLLNKDKVNFVKFNINFNTIKFNKSIKFYLYCNKNLCFSDFTNFYLSDIISRNSSILTVCSKKLKRNLLL